MNIRDNKQLTISVPDNNDEMIFNDALKYLKIKSQNINIRMSTIHLLIKYIMEYIETTSLKGIEQRDMCLRVLRALVIDLTEHEDEIVLLKLIDDGTIANLIDLVVDVSRGKLDINNVIETTGGCFDACFPYLCGIGKNKNKKTNSITNSKTIS